MQTAVGAFGGEAYTDGIEVPPLMVANAGKSDHSEISSLNCPPFMAVELCREHLVGCVALCKVYLKICFRASKTYAHMREHIIFSYTQKHRYKMKISDVSRVFY